MTTEEILENYRKNNYPREEAEQLYEDIKIHFTGEWSDKVIGDRRPNEDESIKDYRKSIWRSPCKMPLGKVVSSLEKIRRSPDFTIIFPKEMPKSIPQSEGLNNYVYKGVRPFGSIVNYTFEVYLNEYLKDANGVILIKWDEVKENEFKSPYPVFIRSENVILYEKNRFVYKVKEKFVEITNNEIIVYEKAKQGYSKNITKNPFGFVYAFKCKSKVKEIKDGFVLNESRLAPMVNSLDEAAREYSDQQGSVVNYMHPEKWEIASEPCVTCRDKETGFSTGFIKIGERQNPCPSCHGKGITGASSPYKKYVVQPNTGLEQQAAQIIPPFGYVTKDTNLIEKIDQRIEKHIYNALSAINMQFLVQTPLNISGEAKAIDKDELNNFVYSVADDLVYFMDKFIEYASKIRYSVQIGQEVESYLPIIRVPERYEYLNENYLIEELSNAKQKGVNVHLVAEMEKEYFKKKFYGNEKMQQKFVDLLELNPLYGMSEEEKMVILNNGGVNSEDYFISANIKQLIDELYLDSSFYLLDFITKKQKIKELAQKIKQPNLVINDTE